VLTMAYLLRMMRGIFYGPTVEQYSHAHDAVGWVDRMPLLLMITTSIFFGIFPGHFYNIIRSGVDPLIARITEVVPIKAEVLSPESSVLSAGTQNRTQHSAFSTQHVVNP
jgi:NADH-quinone oxidoreductase subunit M